jgi:hypothetical protein
METDATRGFCKGIGGLFAFFALAALCLFVASSSPFAGFLLAFSLALVECWFLRLRQSASKPGSKPSAPE